MNNTFNLKRFGMLFKKHTLEHGKTYALSSAVMFGVILLILMFYCYMDRGFLREGDQVMIFVFAMAASGSIFGSIIFADLGDKTKAIPALMLPASHFEKYLVGLIYSYFIFLIVFVAAFYLADVIVISIWDNELKHDKVINLFDPDGKAVAAYKIFTLFHAFIFWGAIFFRKMHFVKTAIVFFLSLGALSLVNVFILNGYFAAQTKFSTGMPFTRIMIVQPDNFMTSLQPTDEFETYGKIVFVIVVLLFWTTTYFKLKEKEV